MKLLTGNDLKTGAVVWWTGETWSLHVAEAADVDGHGEEIARREDWRDRLVVTIDQKSAALIVIETITAMAAAGKPMMTAMVVLYRHELETLLRARDNALAALVSAAGPAGYEADHAVVATVPIDLDAKIESLGI